LSEVVREELSPLLGLGCVTGHCEVRGVFIDPHEDAVLVMVFQVGVRLVSAVARRTVRRKVGQANDIAFADLPEL